MADARGWNLPVTKGTKAWIAGIGSAVMSFLVPLSVVLVNGRTIVDITQAEWVVIAIGFVGGGIGIGGATWAATNRPVEK